MGVNNNNHNHDNKKNKDYTIPFICDECEKETSKAAEVTFYFERAGIVTILTLCHKCISKLKNIQKKIKES